MPSFPTPSQITAQYLTTLKALKPDLNVNDPNSDFVIRGRALAGIISGVYGDQKKVNEDTFLTSARPEAVIQKGLDLDITRLPSSPAKSNNIVITGVNGTTVAVGALTFLYPSTQVIYVNTTGGTIANGQLVVSVVAQSNGQLGNIAAPDTLQIASPPQGVDSSATVGSNVADGADIESIDSLRARILAREQDPPAGGNVSDYPQFAFSADPSVRTSTVRRFGRGLGTVDVFITTGTTDVDSAVNAGAAVVRSPSSDTLAAVQAYYDAHAPLTDDVKVFAPQSVTVPVTVKVRLASGLTLLSVPSDPVLNALNLTVQQLIQREVARAIYKVPVGGRVIPDLGTGFVVAADIEESLDTYLSAVTDPSTGAFLGKLPILADRQVQPLDGSNTNLGLSSNALAEPGPVTVIVGV